MTSPDPDMLRRAQEGDRSAVAAVLGPELDRVYATCRKMVGNRQDAEELAQDALVRIIRGLPTFDGRSSLSTWITRVTINACLTWLRTRARQGGRAPRPLENPDQQMGEPDAPDGVKPDDPAAQRVREALQRISPEHRAVLILRDVRDLDYDAIGAALDLAVGTVKSRIFRARAALRAQVEELERESGARPAENSA